MEETAEIGHLSCPSVVIVGRKTGKENQEKLFAEMIVTL